jgi:sec-independent protein translocase protein TatB
VFGISLTEIAVIAAVTLVIVGPHKLPGLLRTLGQWIRKLRIFTTEMRAQTGIDEILKEEGIEGGVTELRSLLRGDLRGIGARTPRDAAGPAAPYPDLNAVDRYREYPPEGVDAADTLADDLVDEDALREIEHDSPEELAG